MRLKCYLINVLFFQVVILISAFTLPLYYQPGAGHPSLFSVLLYLQCILWSFTVVSWYRFIKKKCTELKHPLLVGIDCRPAYVPTTSKISAEGLFGI